MLFAEKFSRECNRRCRWHEQIHSDREKTQAHRHAPQNLPQDSLHHRHVLVDTRSLQVRGSLNQNGLGHQRPNKKGTYTVRPRGSIGSSRLTFREKKLGFLCWLNRFKVRSCKNNNSNNYKEDHGVIILFFSGRKIEFS